jgi:hypothetical protein
MIAYNVENADLVLRHNESEIDVYWLGDTVFNVTVQEGEGYPWLYQIDTKEAMSFAQANIDDGWKVESKSDAWKEAEKEFGVTIEDAPEEGGSDENIET